MFELKILDLYGKLEKDAPEKNLKSKNQKQLKQQKKGRNCESGSRGLVGRLRSDRQSRLQPDEPELHP